ncbi:uncharacterized protein LOC129601733 [Paramacrobiotus metropolitanus]|uniref:uncharacterized protein LOC129601733 n=1 Tax=Paramacrobiotus metropolitanus TaxID=2943436 RepID=UPI00244579EC|nr:uncharacterized protein LOC129601733 [Paramacrobiotus metropolitanus]
MALTVREIFNISLMFYAAFNCVICSRTSQLFLERYWNPSTTLSQVRELTAKTNSPLEAKRTGNPNQAGTWYLGKRSDLQQAIHDNDSQNSKSGISSPSAMTHNSAGWEAQSDLNGKFTGRSATDLFDTLNTPRLKRSTSDKPKVTNEKPTWYLGKRSAHLESRSAHVSHLVRHSRARNTGEKTVGDKAPWYLG